jgi:hypothetical protein
MPRVRRFLIIGASAIVACLLAAFVVFEVVLVGSGSYTQTLRYYPDGTIREYGRTGWTGREGDWLYWTPDGKIDRDRSGRFNAGFRYWSVDEDAVEEYTRGVSRLQTDLGVLIGWVRCNLDARGGAYPDSLASLLEDTPCLAVLGGSRTVLKDPWGREYQFVADPDGHTFTLFTYGRDGLRGGSGPDSDYAIISEWGQCRFSTSAP